MSGNDSLFDIIVMAVLTAILIAVCIVIANWWGEAQCSWIGQEMKVETKYTLVTDCMIKVNGKFVPLKNYRAY